MWTIGQLLIKIEYIYTEKPRNSNTPFMITITLH